VSVIAVGTRAFADRRRRAEELAGAFAFASEPLRLYAALLAAQERVFERALGDRPGADLLPSYVVRSALPEVMQVAVSAGTEVLREAVLLRFHEGDLEEIVRTWLGGGALDGTDAFLARASTSPVLEACPELGAALRGDAEDDRRCPACGGLPQLAVFGDTGEALVTAQRRLVCARCATEWAYPRLVCVSCREADGAKLPILADESRLAHLRADACDTCRAYLVTVDLRKEPRAVALTDELAALPLDLLATERGYTKISRNVMGY
jgi:formate dehydrogenase maturation protein FdhE